jgi:hypothetical protein
MTGNDHVVPGGFTAFRTRMHMIDGGGVLGATDAAILTF